MGSPLGYVLCCEEHAPATLVKNARLAEEAGFSFAFVSDHFHPWNRAQGHSGYVWSILGAIAQATSHLEFGPAVTCPLFRSHPAVVAQAAATTACLAPGRLFLGLGTGELLNEGILGEPWPPHPVRLQMLEDALAIISGLFEGEEFDFEGRHFKVARAQLYDRPESVPPIMIAASGPRTAGFAAARGYGLIALGPEVLPSFRGSGPRYGQLSVSWAPTQEEGARLAHRLWPVLALEGERYTTLQTPAEVEKACTHIQQQDLAASINCGPDPEPLIATIGAWLEAGFDRVAVHQVGPQQEAFINFFREQVLTHF